MTGLSKERVIQSIDIVVSQNKYKKDRLIKLVEDYNVDNFSIKVVRIVVSYIDYINRTVWKK